MDCALFAGIGAEEQKEMLSCLGARRVEMERGQVIFAQGDEAKRIGVVVRGAVQVCTTDYFGHRFLLAQLEEGELFGEAFVCAGAAAYPVEVICQRSGQALLLDYGRILSVCPRGCARHRKLVENMIAVLAEKNLRLMDRARVLSQRSTREKLLACLSVLARQAGSGRFVLSFTRQELADYLCVDRSAMTVELMKLQSEGKLELNGRQVTLHASQET